MIQFVIKKNNDYYQPYYWEIKSSNGEILAHSEMYASRAGCINSINAVKEGAASAEVKDTTITNSSASFF